MAKQEYYKNLRFSSVISYILCDNHIRVTYGVICTSFIICNCYIGESLRVMSVTDIYPCYTYNKVTQTYTYPIVICISTCGSLKCTGQAIASDNRYNEK